MRKTILIGTLITIAILILMSFTSTVSALSTDFVYHDDNVINTSLVRMNFREIIELIVYLIKSSILNWEPGLFIRELFGWTILLTMVLVIKLIQLYFGWPIFGDESWWRLP
jgi:hypothetical protein